MIENRPAYLLAEAAYKTLPKAPLVFDWTTIPELLRVAMLDLDGIQPPTKEMVEAAGGELQDKPSEGEIALFKKRGTTFQFISIVLSLIAAGENDGVPQFKPFAVTLVPASKRDVVQSEAIDVVAALYVDAWLKAEPMYTGHDPFSGDWSLYGTLPGYLDGQRQGFLDEIGIVIDQFFLATETGADEILVADMKMPTEDMKARYEKHRKKLFFTPFNKIESRRVWGTETPIELFLMQGLARKCLFPECQVLIMSDGAAFPSLYHLWQDLEFQHSDGRFLFSNGARRDLL